MLAFPKVCLVTSTFVHGVLTYGPLQYYSNNVRPKQFLAEFDDWVKLSAREKHGPVLNRHGQEIARHFGDHHCRILQEMAHIERHPNGEPILPVDALPVFAVDQQLHVILSINGFEIP